MATYTIAATGNDGETDTDGNITTNNARVRVGKGATLLYGSWLLFTGVNIPAGATITGAYVNIYGHADKLGIAPLTKISADDSAIPIVPVSRNDFLAKTRTTWQVDWDTQVDTGAWNNSPDISAVIQELVTSYGAYVNGTIQILHDDDGSGASNRQAYYAWDYDDHSKAPQLVITYTTPAAPNAVLGTIGKARLLRIL